MTDPAPEERAAISAAWMHYPGRITNDNIHKDFRAGWAAGRAYERQRQGAEVAALRDALAGMLESYEMLTAMIGLPDITLQVIKSTFLGEPARARAALARPAPDDPARAEDDGR